MQLLALTPAEIAFLTPSGAAAGDMSARLGRKLAATLSARLRLPVQMQAMAAAGQEASASAPVWQPDTALATLWLTRRLGGQRVTGAASFVPRSLLRTLDAALAECWLEAPVPGAAPALAWHIATDLAQAALTVHLPPHTTDMTRWAREVIRHG